MHMSHTLRDQLHPVVNFRVMTRWSWTVAVHRIWSDTLKAWDRVYGPVLEHIGASRRRLWVIGSIEVSRLLKFLQPFRECCNSLVIHQLAKTLESNLFDAAT